MTYRSTTPARRRVAGPPPLTDARRPGPVGPAGRTTRRTVVTAVIAVATVLVASCTDDDSPSTTEQDEVVTEDGGTLSFDGPEDGELIDAEQLEELRFEVVASGDDVTVDDLAVLLDGDDVSADAARDGDRLVYAADHLDDGDHTVAIARLPEDVADASTQEAADTDDDVDATRDPDEPTGDQPGDEATDQEIVHEWSFSVDATPPEIELTSPDGAVVADEPVLIAGTTEADATVSVDGQEVEADDEGAFELELDGPPDGEFQVVAVDPAGNTSAQEQGRLVTVPSRVGLEEIRGVHVTPHAWATSGFREHVLGMIDDGRINTIQLDLKDEGGRIGYDTEVELAIESGAIEAVYSLEEAVEELHGRGIHIVGRIVAFRDPVLGAYAQDNGSMDWLIQTPDGEPYTGQYPCCFTSFANDEVIEYHLDLAEEAAAAGVDDILWDYIRRPDGSPDDMVVPGLSDGADGATLEDAVVDFAARADERLRPYGVGHGVSLYGIAADRPTEIAQDVPALAEHVDYVAPMIYPSHWGPGEYGVEDPNRQPYDIITATLEVWEEATDGTRARIVPWLEDTDYRAWDRPFQVREQIRATLDHGIDEWLMWDPAVNYTVEAYEARDR